MNTIVGFLLVVSVSWKAPSVQGGAVVLQPKVATFAVVVPTKADCRQALLNVEEHGALAAQIFGGMIKPKVKVEADCTEKYTLVEED